MCFRQIAMSQAARPVKIQSIGRAARLLDAMADGRWTPLRALADAAGLAKTTAFTLVTSLVEVGLAEHDERAGTYRLGLRHLSYGRAVERRLDIVTVARPVLIELCAATGETVNLAIPQSTDVLFVDSLEGTQGVRVTSYSGQRAPYHATACGRALMAHWELPRRNALYERGPLEAMTPNTVIDPERLEVIFSECRERGWIHEHEEMELGACCVAAPIFLEDGEIVASVSVAGPAARMSDAKVAEIGDLLVASLAPLSRKLASPR